MEIKYYTSKERWAYEDGLLYMATECIKSCTGCFECCYFNTTYYKCYADHKCSIDEKKLMPIMKAYYSLTHIYDDLTDIK
jgi:hypothetical protein